jgi:NAD(P)-dependent dehydrogenase (short-subunit alcohol dehydrogenase family)
VLVNNSAVTGASAIAKLADITPEHFENVVRVNLGGVIFCSQAAVPHLKASGGGVIVHISSVNAVRPQMGALVYAATKAGLTSVTQSMAKELAADGIRVVAIAPGDIALDHATETDAAIAAKGAGGDVVNQTPLGRGRTADIGETVAFVCSPAARFVTGVTWVVDGGLLA